MDVDNTRLAPSKIAGTSAHSEFGRALGTHTPQWPSWAHAHQHFMFVRIRADLTPSLLVDLKRKQDVLVDEFLTGLLRS